MLKVNRSIVLSPAEIEIAFFTLNVPDKPPQFPGTQLEAGRTKEPPSKRITLALIVSGKVARALGVPRARVVSSAWCLLYFEPVL